MTTANNCCEFPRCTLNAQYCFPDEPTVARFCYKHYDVGAMVPLKCCEFPNCPNAPKYSFYWETSVPRFCEQHKSTDMVLSDTASKDNKPVTTTTRNSLVIQPSNFTPNPISGPSQASLELAYAYFEIKPEYDSLDKVQGQADANRAQLNKLKSSIDTETKNIHKTSDAIAKLEKQIESQDQNLIDCFGKSLFGLGIFSRDQSLVDKKTAELQKGEERVAYLAGQKSQNETSLGAVQTEQNRLDELVEIRNALHARVQELRATCLEQEGTTELRRLQSNHQSHQHMHTSLKQCRQDVTAAHAMFRKALDMQATAARSNAMAAGVNVGQAIGGGGGRGRLSPGERLLQIRRNQMTKQSIQLAQQAAEKLNVAQDRLSNDLRVNFPDEMAGVGIIQVPDLWKGVRI